MVGTDVSSSKCSPIAKSVTFVPSLNKTLEYEEDCSVHAEDIWYIADDYADMKARSRCEAKEWRRQGLGVLLKETFAYPHPAAQDFIKAFVLLEEHQSRRGLERSLSRHHGEERSEMKDRARQSVIIHQKRLKREGCKHDELSEKLAAMYKEVTRCATVFARRLGIADALVVQEGEDSSHAERILNDYQQEKAVHRRAGRRFSNASMASNFSVNSFDSARRFGDLAKVPPVPPKRCPSSPATASEEFYAAIA